MHSEHLRIVDFIKPGKRDRYREMLANPRERHQFISLLPQFADFDSKYRVRVRGELFVDRIARELQKRQCPKVIYAISEDPAIDQKDLLLVEVLPQIVGRGMGTVLSCIPGRLAFVETESERFILERHESYAKCQYVRFVIGSKDDVSHVAQGIFHAAWDALDCELTGSDAKELNELISWFKKNLREPACFSHDNGRRAVCWFKTGSTQHISRIWEMVSILERNGIFVKKIRTDRPGYVVYEDEWQLVAEPFRKGTMTGT